MRCGLIRWNINTQNPDIAARPPLASPFPPPPRRLRVAPSEVHFPIATMNGGAPGFEVESFNLVGVRGVGGMEAWMSLNGTSL